MSIPTVGYTDKNAYKKNRCSPEYYDKNRIIHLILLIWKRTYGWSDQPMVYNDAIRYCHNGNVMGITCI